jgi:parallel beta-helix repeat protein
MPGASEDVLEHGARNDGTTDDTKAFQSAIDVLADAGGGTLHVPPRTFVLAPVTPVVLRADNMTVNAEGATFLRPYRKERPSAMFVSNTRGEPGYGSGVKNVGWHGGRFVGNLSEDNAICPFGLHHAQSCTFERIVSENCHAPNSHQFDLCGCEDITIRDCTFRGQVETEDATAEAIQIDQSYKGALTSGVKNSGFSGLQSRRISVEHCTFEPFTDEEGNLWPGPTPFGSHSAVEGGYYEDIRFAFNSVSDPRSATLFDDPRLDAARGVVHLVSVHGPEVIGNHFTMTHPKQTRVIATNSINYGTVAEADPEDPSGWPKTYWETPNTIEDVLIADNTIEGFTVDPGAEEYGAIVAVGLPGGGVHNMTIRDNVVRGGYQADASRHSAGIELRLTSGANARNNTVVGYYAGIDLHDVSNATVAGNGVRNETGSDFPAGITGKDVTSSHITPGDTTGYAADVDLD